MIRPSGTPVEGVRTVARLADAGASPKLVVLAVKPQKLDEVAAAARAAGSRPKTVLVSILAGVEVASLRERFPGAGAIVRAMPNLPVAVRRGRGRVVQRRGRRRPEAAVRRPVRSARLSACG